MRVYDLAKELGITNKDLVTKLRSIGVQVANHMSMLEVNESEKVRRALSRDKIDNLEEVRLSETVIRRRSRTAPPLPAAAAPPPAPVLVAPAPVPASPRAVAPEPAPVRVEVRAPEPAPAPAPPEAVVRPVEVPAPESPRTRFVERTMSPAPASSASASDSASSVDGSPAGESRLVSVPSQAVTGSAATGRFIQLPGLQARDNVPRVEIKDRDEELRRLGRGAVMPRNMPGANRGAPRPPGGFPPGHRPGGPPRKKQVAAGKKTKQTQITMPAEHKRVVRMGDNISVADLANKMGVKGNEVIKRLWALGMMGITINQTIDQDTATLLTTEFGWQIESTAFREEEMLTREEEENVELLKPRAPVVTIMGHVDHGKTSLLDAIRQSDVAAGEAGGITQHLGAYKVKGKNGDVVFLDTPGHEAFTAMRARGAQMTDIVVLVVAADDGPMPQTIEALNHARAAEVPIIVAINKVDKPGANPQAIRNRMMEYSLVPEEMGGDTIFVDVSAKTRVGVDKLLDMLALQSDVLELKANPDKAGVGHVVEARLDRNRGPISTILVEAGRLKAGDLVVAGVCSGKVRAMLDDRGKQLSEAGPSTPVEILGLDGVPEAGDTFNVVEDEKLAKQIIEHRKEQKRMRDSAATTSRGVSLENILDKIKEGTVKEVKIVLKADVQGSVEAIAQALEKLSTVAVGVKVISSGVGGITESDVTLAKASAAVVIGFNVRPAGKAQQISEQEGVEIKLYQVIYDAIDDVKKAMLGLLEPIVRERVIGKVEVREVFTIPKIGTIAGSFVVDGKLTRRSQVRLVRDLVVIYTGKVGSLRRFKDDASEVEKGYECGVTIEGYADIRKGDMIEVFDVEKVAATLGDPIARGEGKGGGGRSDSAER